jgi:hypothetical protein
MIMVIIIIIESSVSEKICRENQNTYSLFNSSFEKSCHLWDNVEKYVEPDRPQVME